MMALLSMSLGFIIYGPNLEAEPTIIASPGVTVTRILQSSSSCRILALQAVSFLLAVATL